MKDSEYEKLEKARMALDERKHRRELESKERENKRKLVYDNRESRRTAFWNNYNRSEGLAALIILSGLAIVGTLCATIIMYCHHLWYR